MTMMMTRYKCRFLFSFFSLSLFLRFVFSYLTAIVAWFKLIANKLTYNNEQLSIIEFNIQKFLQN